MPAFTVDWLVGSITIPLQSFTCNGSPASVAAGSYYLRHSNSGRSLIDVFCSAVENAMGGGGTGTIRRARRVHLDIAPASDVVWTASALILRNLLGYTADLPSATSHLATTISPLLWSPGYPGTPPHTLRGEDGYEMPHQSIVKSDDGTQSYTYHLGEETWQEYGWSHLDPSRLRQTGTVAAQGGTFKQFWLQCAMLGVRFLNYQDIVEDDSATTTDVTWTTQRGPYVLRPEARRGDWYRRNVPNAEITSSLELPMHVVAEYP